MLQSLIVSFTNAHSLVGSFAHAPTLNEDFHLDSHFYKEFYSLLQPLMENFT